MLTIDLYNTRVVHAAVCSPVSSNVDMDTFVIDVISIFILLHFTYEETMTVTMTNLTPDNRDNKRRTTIYDIKCIEQGYE